MDEELLGEGGIYHEAGYAPSQIQFRDQSNIPLKFDGDPFCNPKVSRLFVRFAEDYFFSQNISQIPQTAEMESPWAELVRVFSDQPSAVVFVRSLTRLLELEIAAGVQMLVASQHQKKLAPKGQLSLNRLSEGLLTAAAIVSNNEVAAGVAVDNFTEQQLTSSSKENMMSSMPNPESSSASFTGAAAPQSVMSSFGGIVPGLPSQVRKPNLIPNPTYPNDTPRDKSIVLERPAAGCPPTMPQSLKPGKRSDRTCEVINCLTEAGYNFKGETKRRFCKKHCLPGMVSVVKFRKCEAMDGCDKMPIYGFEHEKYRKYCAKHKLDGMVNMKGIQCGQAECYKRANCGFEGGRRAFCTAHRRPGMLVLGLGKCARAGCWVGPNYNFKGEKKGKFCSAHKLEGMVHIHSHSCEDKDCSKPARYCFDGEGKPLFCRKHRRPGMASISPSDQTAAVSCPALLLDQKDGQQPRVANTQPPGMTEKRSRRRQAEGRVAAVAGNGGGGGNAGAVVVCGAALTVVDGSTPGGSGTNCTNRAWYNYPGSPAPRRCRGHAARGMVALGRAVCEHEGGGGGGGGEGEGGCGRAAYHGFPGERRPRFCREHRLEGMVYVLRHYTRECAAPGCAKQPSWNRPGEVRPATCKAHADAECRSVPKAASQLLGSTNPLAMSLLTLENTADGTGEALPRGRAVAAARARCGGPSGHALPKEIGGGVCGPREGRSPPQSGPADGPCVRVFTAPWGRIRSELETLRGAGMEGAAGDLVPDEAALVREVRQAFAAPLAEAARGGPGEEGEGGGGEEGTGGGGEGAPSSRRRRRRGGGLPPLPAPGALGTFEQARDVFKEANACYNRAKDFYLLDGFVTDHVDMLRRQSQLYRLLAGFESDDKRKQAMHTRRINLLEPLLSVLNKKVFMDFHKQLSYEVAETFSSIVDIKIGRIEAKKTPKKAELEKCNDFVDKAISNFQYFADLYMNDINPETKEENSIPKEQLGPFLRSHFHIARLHGKKLYKDSKLAVASLSRSVLKYEWLLARARRELDRVGDWGLFQQEYDICRQMVELLPEKINRMHHGQKAL